MPLIACAEPLNPITFQLDRETGHPIEWQVTMQEDGCLVIISTGRRQGRIHIEPGSHTSITVTTDRITKGEI